ncbi:MAG: sterol carrier protein [Pyrobaculum sp.]
MLTFNSEWAFELCKNISGKETEGALVIKAVEVPRDVSSSGIYTLRLVFKDGMCIESVVSKEDLDGDYVLEGRFEDFKKILEGSLPPFAAFALGKVRLRKGELSKLADYMPLALDIVKKARELLLKK